MIRPLPKGPRSLIRTSTDLPFARWVTVTTLPQGSVGCAAVNLFWSKSSPLAVRLPLCLAPYHVAKPISTIRGRGAGSIAGGGASGVSDADGMIEIDGIWGEDALLDGGSTEWFSLGISGGDCGSVDTARWGASATGAQPGPTDNSIAASIPVSIRRQTEPT